jgi:hypothetical protein
MDAFDPTTRRAKSDCDSRILVRWRLRSESPALLASRATFSVRGAERRLALATATKESGASRQVARTIDRP